MAKHKNKDLSSIKQYNVEKSDQYLIEEKCSETLTKNYMPYAMSVIVSRALPEIDGLKPAHRKVLYTMYKMGLLSGPKTKSANIVGQTMRLNPHGDCLAGNTLLYGYTENGLKAYTIKELYESKTEKLHFFAMNTSNEIVLAFAHSFRIGQYTNKKYKITFSNNYSIETTENHPFYIKKGKKYVWIKAENLKINDIVCSSKYPTIYSSSFMMDDLKTIEKRDFIKIKCVETIDTDNEPMYDFTVDDYENLFIPIFNTENLTKPAFICVHNSSIYETMCRMTQNQESLLAPYIEGKGNFGKVYSRDMAEAASRYTEAKLAPIAEELFKDINKNTIPFVPNYDNTMLEPSLLPVSFPTILANTTLGIAVGMASNICSFNLKELLDATIGLMRDEDFDIKSVMPGPDFTTGGEIIYDEAQYDNIINTGKGSIVIRAKYNYDKKNNIIEITEIPPTTTIEAIIEKVTDLVKQGKIKEINDIRDETDLNGLKIAIDMKRGQDIEKFMPKLFKMTSCEDTYSCNFNLLINGNPVVLGVRDILKEWISFRINCVKNRIEFDIKNKEDKLHLLKGLESILLDIDKTINIIRNSSDENDVIADLMIGFGIDEKQAEYISEIKLKHLNKDYILKRTSEISELSKEILELSEIFNSDNKIKKLIEKELKDISKKYSLPRKTTIMYNKPEEYEKESKEVQSYPANIFITKENYVKKITPLSLRMGSEQKLKEKDKIIYTFESNNDTDLLFFTNKYQCYKLPVDSIPQCKASVLGEFLLSLIELEKDEKIVHIINADKEYSGYMIFVFENGKVAKIPLKSYETKTNRKKLLNAYSDIEKVSKILYIKENTEIFLQSTDKRGIIFNTADILEKTTKNTIGVTVLKLKEGQKINKVLVGEDINIKNKEYYYVNIASVGYNPAKKSSKPKVNNNISLFDSLPFLKEEKED